MFWVVLYSTIYCYIYICQIRSCPLFTFCPVNRNIGASICLIQKNSCSHPLQWRLVSSRSTVREYQTVTGPKSHHHWDKSIITTVIIIISNRRIFLFPLSLGFYQQQQQQWLRFSLCQQQGYSLNLAGHVQSHLFTKFFRTRRSPSMHIIVSFQWHHTCVKDTSEAKDSTGLCKIRYPKCLFFSIFKFPHVWSWFQVTVVESPWQGLIFKPFLKDLRCVWAHYPAAAWFLPHKDANCRVKHFYEEWRAALPLSVEKSIWTPPDLNNISLWVWSSQSCSRNTRKIESTEMYSWTESFWWGLGNKTSQLG